jgi:hypothetical protein
LRGAQVAGAASSPHSFLALFLPEKRLRGTLPDVNAKSPEMKKMHFSAEIGV